MQDDSLLLTRCQPRRSVRRQTRTKGSVRPLRNAEKETPCVAARRWNGLAWALAAKVRL
jgi:hypothetical protein